MLTLSRLGFGTAGLGNHRVARSDDEAAALLEAAWAAGIRHFDTAPHYGLGLAERRLGSFLRTKPREEYVVSTKVGRLLVDSPETAGDLDHEGFVVAATHTRRWDFSRDGVRASLDASLQRLGLDRVDVLYLHDPERWDLDGALSTGLPALAELREQGMVRAVGVGSMRTDALLAAARSGLSDLLMAAGRYTLASPDLAEDVLDACAAHGVGVVAAAVFNGGLLAGSPVAGTTFDYEAAPPDLLARVARIDATCRRHGVPLRAAAVQFPLRAPQVVSVVAGGDSPAQIAELAADLAATVPEALWEDLRREGLL